MSNLALKPFLQAQLPTCHLATATAAATQDPERAAVVVTCDAPARIAAACGYPGAGTCPHRGPFSGAEDRAEETSSCLIRQYLGLQ